jgi:hypothetical protein
MAVPTGKVKEVSAMLKAIHAQEIKEDKGTGCVLQKRGRSRK